MADAPSPLSALACTHLRGVGPRLASRLQKLGIHTIQDLLFHLPMRYQDRTHVTPLNQVRPGDHVVVEGEIVETVIRRSRRTSLLCSIKDGAGILTLRFFYFTPAQQQALAQSGVRIRCFGEVRWGTGSFEMIHPEYRLHPQNLQPADEHLTPIYPTTEGVTQGIWRKLTDQGLALLQQGGALEEYLPMSILEQFALLNLSEALNYVHRPPTDAQQNQLEAGTHPAQQRLAFEELMAHQLSLRQLRVQVHQHPAPKLLAADIQTDLFLQQLPFSLTAAQQRVCAEICHDLQQDRPMLRLVQGDVGSGKTVVAAMAIVQAVANGFQAALMAPTELLAEQHLNNFSRWLEPLGIKVVWLAGGLKASVRAQALAQIEQGEAQVIIGTHALFQKDVTFARLALVVIDEQHRFGVHQRLELREKGIKQSYHPHQLIMTATPIPRTLAMTAYADLDYSVIDELPPGRTGITTSVISNQRREEVIQRVRHACQSGQQAYWVCTLIEESEVLQCQAVEDTAALLKQLLPELQLGLIHGRLKPQEKDQIMAAFKQGHLNLLVATTVIEVGVDVPNATLMIIENAERLGLAQLHQLRGRVGRGCATSYCVLMYQNPLSSLAKQRLAVLRNTHDGFEIAQHDLELRGPGEVLGTRQTGLMHLRIADLIRDKQLLPTVQKATDQLLQEYPDRVESLIYRWIAHGERYGNV